MVSDKILIIQAGSGIESNADVAVNIEGHTDSIPIRAKFQLTQAAIAVSLLCISPFTFSKPVIAPLFVPKLHPIAIQTKKYRNCTCMVRIHSL